MSRDIPPVLQQLIGRDVLYPFFTVTLNFDSQVLNFWTGAGQLVVDGITYIGTGNLLQVTDIEETTELAVRGATLTLSGMDSAIVSLALQEPYQGRNCSVNFGLYSSLVEPGSLLQEQAFPSFILLESGGQIDLEGDIAFTEVFSGYMDTMDIAESAETSTIALGVSNKLIDLERRRVFRYNSATQKILHPLDKGFDFVESQTGRTIYWGQNKPT